MVYGAGCRSYAARIFRQRRYAVFGGFGQNDKCDAGEYTLFAERCATEYAGGHRSRWPTHSWAEKTGFGGFELERNATSYDWFYLFK